MSVMGQFSQHGNTWFLSHALYPYLVLNRSGIFSVRYRSTTVFTVGETLTIGAITFKACAACCAAFFVRNWCSVPMR